MKANKKRVRQLISDLDLVSGSIASVEKEYGPSLTDIHPCFEASARNLIHYLGLRRSDHRDLQSSLDDLGVSHLGETEGHVKASVHAVDDMLHQIIGSEVRKHDTDVISMKRARKLTRSTTNALLGKKLKGNSVRIMVTLPTTAAEDKKLVRGLISAGMNCARINCAHDDKETWSAMIGRINKAKRKTGRGCKVCMDLGGPKLRTGPIMPGPKVVHLSPERDDLGRVISPSQVWLGAPYLLPPSKAETVIPVNNDWVKTIRKGDEIRFRDTRNKKCVLRVGRKQAKGRWAQCYDSAYIKTDTRFSLHKKGKKKRKSGSTPVLEIRPIEQSIRLRVGDILDVHSDPSPGEPAMITPEGRVQKPAHISCTLPEAFKDLRAGEEIQFDDGKIRGIIHSVTPSEIQVRVTQAGIEGTRLAADKGINLPGSNLKLSGLTSKDKDDLKFVAENADIVSMSFVNGPEDVLDLVEELEKLNAPNLGIILKIETQRAVRNLPGILLTGMRRHPLGIMIARGDLAIEVGFEEMAETQEEILWMCDAAHVPVVWATQVLEKLAKKGLPTRAEITDAAMAQRAECVMLNKGPYILEAVRMLENIIRRMQDHQTKKRPTLTKLSDQFNGEHIPTRTTNPRQVPLSESYRGSV